MRRTVSSLQASSILDGIMASLGATRTQVLELDSRLQALSTLVAENEEGLAEAAQRANTTRQLTVEVEQVGD